MRWGLRRSSQFGSAASLLSNAFEPWCQTAHWEHLRPKRAGCPALRHLRRRSSSRRLGLHGRSQHERAGRANQSWSDRRRCLPPQPSQEQLGKFDPPCPETHRSADLARALSTGNKIKSNGRCYCTAWGIGNSKNPKKEFNSSLVHDCIGT